MRYLTLLILFTITSCSPKIKWASEEAKDDILKNVLSDLKADGIDSLITVKNECIGCAISNKPDTTFSYRLPYHVFYRKNGISYLKVIDSYFQYKPQVLANDTLIGHILKSLDQISKDTLVYGIKEPGYEIVAPNHHHYRDVELTLGDDKLRFDLRSYYFTEMNTDYYVDNLNTKKYRLITELESRVRNLKGKKEKTTYNNR